MTLPSVAPGGAKHDAGKDRWDLLPWGPVREIVRVLGYGAAKYAPNQWQIVPNARERYFAAAQRHLFEWRQGHFLDPESRLPHLAHAACCLLFLLWVDEAAFASPEEIASAIEEESLVTAAHVAPGGPTMTRRDQCPARPHKPGAEGATPSSAIYRGES